MGKGNDQLVRTVPGTDVGGHDTAGVDGEVRTERSGEILGTPDLTPDVKRRGDEARELETKKADYIREEVDRANREDLPKLGGNLEDTWEPGDSKGKKAAKSAAPATPAATRTAPAPAIGKAAPATPSSTADSGITLSRETSARVSDKK